MTSTQTAASRDAMPEPERLVEEEEFVESMGVPDQPACQTAHDLANFLNGMGMLLYGLEKGVPPESGLRPHVEALRRASRNANDLCHRLQASLQGQEPHVRPPTTAVDLNRLVLGMEPLIRAMLPRTVQLDLQLGEPAPCIRANPTQVRQIVLDLITNASESLGQRPGGIQVRTEVISSEQATPGDESDPVASDPNGIARDWTVLEVVDTGCGMDERTLQRIFEPSFTTKSNQQGLGLASVRWLVRASRGTVTVDSRVGQGTRIRCHFPRSVMQDAHTCAN